MSQSSEFDFGSFVKSPPPKDPFSNFEAKQQFAQLPANQLSSQLPGKSQ